MFSNSSAKTVITYDLVIYGTTYKTDLSRIEAVQREILFAKFFKRKFESLEKVFADNKVLTVFELFLVEILKEFVRQRGLNHLVFSFNQIKRMIPCFKQGG